MGNARCWVRVALVGAVGWCALGWLGAGGPDGGPAAADLGRIERLLQLHLLCLTPLLLATTGLPGSSLATPAAACVVVSAALPRGSIAAAALAGAWPLLGAWLLAAALRGARGRCAGPGVDQPGAARLDVPGAARALGVVFLAVGGGWIVAARAGVVLPGLDAGKTLLAAIHAHYTGASALLLLGALAEASGPERPGVRRWAALVALGVGVGFATTGVGIALAPPLEVVGAALLLLALGGLAGAGVVRALAAPAPLARHLRLASSLALLLALGLGLAYAARVPLGRPTLVRAEMITWHGWTVALGFVLCGGAAALLDPGARARRR